MSKHELISLIEEKRAELIQVVSSSGLTSAKAVKYSQELDSLLNQYNRLFIQQNNGDTISKSATATV